MAFLPTGVSSAPDAPLALCTTTAEPRIKISDDNAQYPRRYTVVIVTVDTESVTVDTERGIQRGRQHLVSDGSQPILIRFTCRKAHTV